MRLFLLVAGAAALLAACSMGVMLPGAIISEQGNVLEFKIEVARRSGAVSAHDPKTGERFSGNYVAIVMGSNIANTNAYLTGDKGTTLNCQMKIEGGFSPHGIGGCTDQRGGRYRLQF